MNGAKLHVYMLCIKINKTNLSLSAVNKDKLLTIIILKCKAILLLDHWSM